MPQSIPRQSNSRNLRIPVQISYSVCPGSRIGYNRCKCPAKRNVIGAVNSKNMIPYKKRNHALSFLNLRLVLVIWYPGDNGSKGHWVLVIFSSSKKDGKLRNTIAFYRSDDFKTTLEILVDRGSVEVYANDGGAFLSWPQYLFEPDQLDLSMTAIGAESKVNSLELWPISSTWPDLSAKSKQVHPNRRIGAAEHANETVIGGGGDLCGSVGCRGRYSYSSCSAGR